MDRFGKPSRLTYAPVDHAGWSLALIYPEEELLAEVRSTLLQQLALLVAGLVVLTAVVWLLARRLTQPIEALAAGALELATGDLDAELPAPASRDEVGALTRSSARCATPSRPISAI